jgi:hypothetical protein
MNHEQKRIKIAETCGWTIADPPDYEDGALMGHHKIAGTEFLGWDMVPDYFKDLNACFDVHKGMDLVHQIQWHIQLQQMVRKRCAYNLDEISILMVCCISPASERAEAIGLALGLWKEGE